MVLRKCCCFSLKTGAIIGVFTQVLEFIICFYIIYHDLNLRGVGTMIMFIILFLANLAMVFCTDSETPGLLLPQMYVLLMKILGLFIALIYSGYWLIKNVDQGTETTEEQTQMVKIHAIAWALIALDLWFLLVHFSYYKQLKSETVPTQSGFEMIRTDLEQIRDYQRGRRF